MATQSRRLLFLLGSPVVGVYAIHRGLTTLEARYAALPADDSTSSVALRTPGSPSTQHSPHIDIYSARIPVKALLARTNNPSDPKNSDNATLSTVWAQSVFGSRIFRLEGRIFGLFAAERKFEPGDVGNTPEAFNPVSTNSDCTAGRDEGKRKLLHGALTVERPPSLNSPHGLLVSWKMPDKPRIFFEKIARWGYPWRLMSGGRHELSVSEPFMIPGRDEQGPFVEVRFASAHDYEIFSEEGELKDQKTIPGWSARLHRGYAMAILDRAVRELMAGH
ncbi:uncharacterized protein BJX67DRAFT_353720 [Aspergillus lucknowensis]|uniref:Uncharacterized protein n=1 Tax=Aspergillus lucknowensis TaxID=176173 RepID=A0ABR4LR64_9EURO